MIEFIKNLEWVTILTVIGTGATVIGLVHTFLRNFKIDIYSRIDRLESRLDKTENKFEQKITSLDERMFFLATGKRLEDAILEENLKRQKPKTNP